MKFVVVAVLAITATAAGAQKPSAQALFEIVEVNRDTVPAGTPEAFEAAFGENTRSGAGRWYETVRELEGQSFTFVPLTLIPLPDGRSALVSTGASDCTGQACSGRNTIHYLRREGARYAVDGEWLDVGASGVVGNPATRWGRTDAIADDPVLYTEGGGVWQGHSCSYASLTQLTATGPVEIARLPVHYSNGGAAEDAAAIVTLSGSIVAAVKGREFTVRYTGSRDFSEKYVRNADGQYLPAAASRMSPCAGTAK